MATASSDACLCRGAGFTQPAWALRGGGGSGERSGVSGKGSLPAVARAVDKILLTGDSPAKKPRLRLLIVTYVSATGLSEERMQPQSLSPGSAWLAQRHPDRRHALPPEQQHPAAAFHNELVAKTGPRPSHKQTRIARPLPISASILSDSDSRMRLFLQRG